MQHYFGAKANPSERHELTQASVTVSVISHRQGRLVRALLEDLDSYCAGTCEVILTVNVPEDLDLATAGRRKPVTVVENAVPRGFAANTVAKE